MRFRCVVWMALLVLSGCSYMEPTPRPLGGGNERERPVGGYPGSDAAVAVGRDHDAESEGEPQQAVPSQQRRRTWTGLTDEQIVALAEEIKAFLNAPYVWGGSSPEGTDCSGFVYAVFRRAWGLTLPRSAEAMYRIGEPVERDCLRFSDLVFFEAAGVGEVTHVGIYVAKGLFVHASPTRGVVISGLDEAYYRQRYVGARRLVGYVLR